MQTIQPEIIEDGDNVTILRLVANAPVSATTRSLILRAPRDGLVTKVVSQYTGGAITFRVDINGTDVPFGLGSTDVTEPAGAVNTSNTHFSGFSTPHPINTDLAYVNPDDEITLEFTSVTGGASDFIAEVHVRWVSRETS